MKKISSTLFLVALAFNSYSQTTGTTWNTNLNTGSATTKLGTNNASDLIFYTNNNEGLKLTKDGKINIHGLSGSGPRLLCVDASGNLGPMPGAEGGQGPADPCLSIVPWYQGGNNNPGDLEIGTCTNHDFILKTYNKECIFLKPATGYVGVGINNNNPQAALDVSSYPSANYRMLISGDAHGRITALNTNMNLIADGSFYVHAGTANTPPFNGAVYSKLSVNANGFVGIGTYTPNAKFEVRDASNVEALIRCTSSGTSKLIVQNSLTSYEFKVESSGIARISAGNTNHFSFGVTNTGDPQVWVGTKKPAAPNDNFSFAVGGKFVAQSIYVTANTNTNWPDYVFADNYKLPQLSDVEKFYKKNKHLPEIPAAKDIEERGIDVGEINTLLLKKVEELTIYIVDQQKEINLLKDEVKSIKNKN